LTTVNASTITNGLNFRIQEHSMASRTAITEARRKAKHRAMGAKRKAADRNKGTTPKFAVHEGAAPKAAKAASK
jgi:hypothetical protein